jgi:hypothetical protein
LRETICRVTESESNHASISTAASTFADKNLSLGSTTEIIYQTALQGFFKFMVSIFSETVILYYSSRTYTDTHTHTHTHTYIYIYIYIMKQLLMELIARNRNCQVV